MIKVKDYEQLSRIMWYIHTDEIEEEIALRIYERNWSFVNEEKLSQKEIELIEKLVKEFNPSGVLHVL